MDLSVSLTDDLAAFVDGKVAHGHYASASEVVADALRLLERVEATQVEQLAQLRQAWHDGIESGDAGAIDFAALKAEARDRLRR